MLWLYMHAIDSVFHVPVASGDCSCVQVVRTMECNLGNLVVDIMRHSLDAVAERPLDCTILNGGTMRSDMVHQNGMLTKRDLLSILPMMDEVAVVEITGKDLLRALEVGVSSYPKLEGRFLHVCSPGFVLALLSCALYINERIHKRYVP